MKIIQLVNRVEASGITRYTIELNKALNLIGHDTEIVLCYNNLYDEDEVAKQNVPNFSLMYYGEELTNKINSADIVLINSIPHIKVEQQYKNEFYKLIREATHPIKALFCNDHNTLGIRYYYGFEYIDNPELILKYIDKFVVFSPYNEIIQRINKHYPEIIKKYVHLQHPYTFSDKSNWIDFDKKYRRITYLGRFAKFKDPMRLVRNRDIFFNNDYQVEMRGIYKVISVATEKDLFYSFDNNGNNIGKCPTTLDCGIIKNVIENYPGEPFDLIHLNDRQKKIHIFGKYKREDGMKAVSYSLFGCDFCWNKNPLIYGDNIEYAVAEIIDAGTIPFLDTNTMKNCNLYVDNMRTTTSFNTMNCGICINKEATDINEAIEKMNYLASNKDAYNEYRESCFNLYKEHYDPVRVATRLIEDLMNDDNSYALDEFNYK